MRVRHVLFRNKRRNRELQGRVRLLLHHMPFQPLNGLLHHLHIEIQADRGDMARLLFAQKITGPSDLKVRRGDTEARSEFGELLNRDQSLLRIAGECAFVGDQEVGVGLLSAASDPSTQLVQLRQAEEIRSIDDDGVGVGNVESGLDDGRGDQDVRLALHEFQHDGFQRPGIHLPVRHDHTGFGNQLVQPCADPLHGFDTIVDKIDLSPTSEFAQDGVPHGLVAEPDHLRVDRQSTGGGVSMIERSRTLGHRHLQRAGNRCRRQGQDIDLRAQVVSSAPCA